MSDFQYQSTISHSEETSQERTAKRRRAVKEQQRMRIRIPHFLALFIVGAWVVLSFLTQDTVGSEVIVTCIILAFILLVEFQNFDALKNSKQNSPQK